MKKLLIFILLCSPAMAGTKQKLFSLGTTATTANRYLSLTSVESEISEGRVVSIMPVAGTLRNMYVLLSGDPGAAGDYYDFILRKSTDDGATWAGCGPSVRITGDTSSYRNQDTSNSCSVNAGDLIGILIDPTSAGTLSAVTAKICIEFEGSGSKQNIIVGGYGTISTSANNYIALMGNMLGATEPPAEIILPMSGTISAFSARMNSALTSGSYTLTLRRNGASEGSISCTLDAENQKCSDPDASSISVSAGDRLTVLSSPSSPNEAKFISISVLFTTDTASQFFIAANSRTSYLSNADPRYLTVAPAGVAPSATSNVSAFFLDTFTITKAYGYMSAAQGAGKSYGTKLQKDTEDTSPTFALTFSNTKGPFPSEDGSYVPAAWSLYSTLATPNGTPTVGLLIISYLASDSTTTTIRRNRMSLLGVR